MVSFEGSTRDRILEAAGPIFAEKGLRGATVRDIVRAAEVNQAAINYHFGDKDKLYSEVLRYGINVAFAQNPPDGGVPASAEPELRLRGLVEGVVRRHMAIDHNAWHGRLMWREFQDPSPQFLLLIDEFIAMFVPMTEDIIGQLNPQLSAEQRWWCAQSVLSLTNSTSEDHTFLVRQRPEWVELAEEQRRELLADHLYRFCRAAIGGFK